jgi:Zn-finger nucleic acid-binding protein
MGRPFRTPVYTQFKLTRTKQTEFGEEPDIEINIVCFKDVGVWTNRNEESQIIAKQLVKDISKRCNHSRKHMSNPYKWTRILEMYKTLFNLQGGKIECQT